METAGTATMERDMQSAAEQENIETETDVLLAITKKLGTIDESDRPRVLGAVAVFYGIEKFPTVSFSPRHV